MGILTSKEFYKRADEGVLHNPAPQNVRSPSSEELAARGLEKQRRIILPFAPKKGETRAAFYLNGEEVVLTLVDQEYVFPDSMSEDEKDRMAKALEPAGFVDETTIKKLTPKIKPRRFAHPDNEIDAAVSGVLKFKFRHNGKKRQVTVELDEFGTITTDDPGLQAKLVRDKWPEVTVPEGVEAGDSGPGMTDPYNCDETGEPPVGEPVDGCSEDGGPLLDPDSELDPHEDEEDE